MTRAKAPVLMRPCAGRELFGFSGFSRLVNVSMEHDKDTSTSQGFNIVLRSEWRSSNLARRLYHPQVLLD